MSAKIMGGVFDLDLTPAQQIVLLAYADHADHLGRNVYPSKKLIAWKTGYGLRQVQRITDQLVTLEIMKVVEAQSGKAVKYSIHLEKGKKKPPFVEGGRQNVTPDIVVSSHPRQNVTPTHDIAVPEMITNHQYNRHVEPSKPLRAVSNGKAGKDWTTDELALVDTFRQFVDSIVPIWNETKAKQDETRRACGMLISVGVTAPQLRQFLTSEYKNSYKPSSLLEATRKIGAWLAKQPSQVSTLTSNGLTQLQKAMSDD